MRREGKWDELLGGINAYDSDIWFHGDLNGETVSFGVLLWKKKDLRNTGNTSGFSQKKAKISATFMSKKLIDIEHGHCFKNERQLNYLIV